MTDLELMLQAAGTTADWPQTPNLAAAVQLRIAPGRPRRLRRRWLVVAFAALVIAAGAAAAVLHHDRHRNPPKPSPAAQLRFARHSPSIVIRQIQGRLVPQYLFKFVPPRAHLEYLTIGRDNAYWVRGPAHQFIYRSRSGLQTGGVQPSGPVLFWQHGRLLVEIAGAKTRAKALALARSAREAP